MSEKQDRQGVRTAADLERKYKMNWTRPFAELTGISRDMRQQVERVESELRGDMTEGFTEAAAETERLIEAALEDYATAAELERHRQTADQALLDLSGRLDTAALGAHPVGSLYFAVGDAAPDTLFGGTWEKLSDALTLPADAEGTGEDESGTAESPVYFTAWVRIE